MTIDRPTFIAADATQVAQNGTTLRIGLTINGQYGKSTGFRRVGMRCCLAIIETGVIRWCGVFERDPTHHKRQSQRLTESSDGPVEKLILRHCVSWGCQRVRAQCNFLSQTLSSFVLSWSYTQDQQPAIGWKINCRMVFMRLRLGDETEMPSGRPQQISALEKDMSSKKKAGTPANWSLQLLFISFYCSLGQNTGQLDSNACASQLFQLRGCLNGIGSFWAIRIWGLCWSMYTFSAATICPWLPFPGPPSEETPRPFFESNLGLADLHSTSVEPD